jgi:hypothetical protein
MEELKKWRESADLSPSGRAFCTDLTLRRYATARRGDYDAALSMLQNSIEWREEAVKEPLGCEICEADPTSHCFFPIGTTVGDENIVIYGNPPRASNREVPQTVTHVVHSLEHCWSATSPSKVEGSRWVWVVDFNGFGWTHALEVRLGSAFASMFASHFPERLHLLLLLNPPTVFQMLLSAIRPFADERTMSKVQALTGSTEEVVSALAERKLSDESLEWMRRVLDMRPVPGSLPPLTDAMKRLQLPNITLPAVEEE